jgi:hypothetical protein
VQDWSSCVNLYTECNTEWWEAARMGDVWF